ncbi:cytochrome P450 98A3 [Dichomitus squalens]|uniref:Cytochrome P450 98A3 n=1 Tax=Dichomitus squalens TaxID=114155 RepID=A0A4Q9Q2R5_9APHY|nr:cytochrome P450 98A3 [Dichomitus squalens]TBU61425.1 cytochrome P450 98A3 [Dichomitus squalens]
MPVWLWNATVGIILLATTVRWRCKRIAHLPPGPTPFPIIGNILNVPREHLGREFADLTKTFGDVVHLSVLGQSTIVLGSQKAAYDLLDKRSANYSHRPASVMVPLVGYEWLFALMNDGQRWRQHRRAVHPTLTPDIVREYQPIQSKVARRFVRSILRSPQDLALHIRFTFAAIVMEVIYGIEIREAHDKYFKMVERMAEVGEAIVMPGRFPVEAFPALRYLPSWFPGGGFKNFAADAKRDISYIIDHLFETAKTAMVSDTSGSVVSRILGASEDEDAQLEGMCKEVAGTLYVGTCYTLTNATMEAFLLAMALYPQAQEKAQAELDAVVGTERLPEFSDRPSLPYIDALVQELLRWYPVTPIGVPHRVVADDEYNGYVIPGGATIFVNVWAILRDPDVYPDPEDFKPERFLNSRGEFDVGERDPAEILFGFGRRVCPGRHLAQATLFILCACVLAAFKIVRPVDEHGAPKEIKREATDANVISLVVSRSCRLSFIEVHLDRHPKVHRYTMQPRSSKLQQYLGLAQDD